MSRLSREPEHGSVSSFGADALASNTGKQARQQRYGSVRNSTQAVLPSSMTTSCW